jgi:hypothetical protein
MRTEILKNISYLENNHKSATQAASCNEAIRLLSLGEEEAAMGVIRAFKRYQTNNANYQYQLLQQREANTIAGNYGRSGF